MEAKQRSLQETTALLQSVEGRFQQLSNSLQQAQREMAGKLQEYDFVTAEQVEDYLLTAEEWEAAKEQIQTYNEQAKLLRSEQAKLEQQLKGQTVSAEEWQAIQEQRTAADAAVKEATEIRAVAQAHYQNLQTQNILWEQLEQKRLDFSKQEGHLNHLKTLLAGDKFVEFLAQEQMEFVTRQASDRLKRLTRNRYALEVAPDGGFLIGDDANGGVKRPVTTLSGGETFLTSLALALSLSTQIQLRGKYPLEFFSWTKASVPSMRICSMW